MRGALRKLKSRRDGVTAVEFAILALPLFTLMFGGLDLAYQAYATAVLQGTVNAGARKGTLEGATTTAIETYVREQLKEIAKGDKVIISSSSFEKYSKIGKPEKLTTDVNGNGSYDKFGPDCFIDDNLNNTYDTASQGKSGIGQAEDIVRFSVTMTFDRLTPLANLIGMGNTVTVSRSTLLQNEPYAGVVDPPVRCGV